MQIFNPNFYLTGLYSHQNSVFNLIPDAGQRCTTLSCALNGPTTWLDINVVPHRSFIAFTTERPQTQYRGDASSFFSTGSVSHELKYGFGYRKAPVTSFSAYAGNAFGLMFDTQLVPGGSGGAYLLRPTNFTYDVKSQDAYVGDTVMLASDGECAGNPSFKGFALSLTAADHAEAERMFAALGDGGQVQMPLGKTFFSPSFGMVADRFGVSWMVYVAQ